MVFKSAPSILDKPSDHDVTRMLPHCFEIGLQIIRRKIVVAINEHQISSRSLCYTMFSALARSAILLILKND